MGIFKLSNMTLVPQIHNGGCWCASAIMLYKWSRKSGLHRMVEPLSDPGIKWRWTENKDWGSSDNWWLSQTLNIETHSSIPLEYAELKTFLKEHGPIWTSGMKTWSGEAHGHVVVICGVANTGVFIYDPEPVGYGCSRWLTWTQISDYILGSDASIQFMTVK